MSVPPYRYCTGWRGVNMPSHVGKKHKTWVLVQAISKPVQDFDETSATWQTLHTVRASITPVASDEPLEGNQRRKATNHEVELRWMPDIDAACRVVIEDGSAASDEDKRILHIESIVNWQDQNRYLILNCVEKS